MSDNIHMPFTLDGGADAPDQNPAGTWGGVQQSDQGYIATAMQTGDDLFGTADNQLVNGGFDNNVGAQQHVTNGVDQQDLAGLHGGNGPNFSWANAFEMQTNVAFGRNAKTYSSGTSPGSHSAYSQDVNGVAAGMNGYYHNGVDLEAGVSPLGTSASYFAEPYPYDSNRSNTYSQAGNNSSVGDSVYSPFNQNVAVDTNTLTYGADINTPAYGPNHPSPHGSSGFPTPRSKAVRQIKREEEDGDFYPGDHAMSDDANDETYTEQPGGKKRKLSKFNKDGKARKVRQPRGPLRRWDQNDIQRALLGIVWACGENGVQIPFAQAAQMISPNTTQSAFEQAILKLRVHMNDPEGANAQIPKIKMNWPKKGGNKGADNAAPNVRDNGKLPRRKPTLVKGVQCNLTTLTLRGEAGRNALMNHGLGNGGAPNGYVPDYDNVTNIQARSVMLPQPQFVIPPQATGALDQDATSSTQADTSTDMHTASASSAPEQQDSQLEEGLTSDSTDIKQEGEEETMAENDDSLVFGNLGTIPQTPRNPNQFNELVCPPAPRRIRDLAQQHASHRAGRFEHLAHLNNARGRRNIEDVGPSELADAALAIECGSPLPRRPSQQGQGSSTGSVLGSPFSFRRDSGINYTQGSCSNEYPDMSPEALRSFGRDANYRFHDNIGRAQAGFTLDTYVAPNPQLQPLSTFVRTSQPLFDPFNVNPQAQQQLGGQQSAQPFNFTSQAQQQLGDQQSAQQQSTMSSSEEFFEWVDYPDEN